MYVRSFLVAVYLVYSVCRPTNYYMLMEKVGPTCKYISLVATYIQCSVCTSM